MINFSGNKVIVHEDITLDADTRDALGLPIGYKIEAGEYNVLQETLTDIIVEF